MLALLSSYRGIDDSFICDLLFQYYSYLNVHKYPSVSKTPNIRDHLDPDYFIFCSDILCRILVLRINYFYSILSSLLPSSLPTSLTIPPSLPLLPSALLPSPLHSSLSSPSSPSFPSPSFPSPSLSFLPLSVPLLSVPLLLLSTHQGSTLRPITSLL